MMERGAANRRTGETRMNARSSRSHQILTVIVDGAPAGGVEPPARACMHLVDLAGSERVDKSEATGARRRLQAAAVATASQPPSPSSALLQPFSPHSAKPLQTFSNTPATLPNPPKTTGERLTEATYINKSLSALGDVMAALAAKNAHVPFRNSKLTQLLQDSLCGNAKARAASKARAPPTLPLPTACHDRLRRPSPPNLCKPN